MSIETMVKAQECSIDLLANVQMVSNFKQFTEVKNFSGRLVHLLRRHELKMSYNPRELGETMVMGC